MNLWSEEQVPWLSLKFGKFNNYDETSSGVIEKSRCPCFEPTFNTSDNSPILGAKVL